MPYVNIPDSGLGGVVAVLVGKIQGKLSAQVLNKATQITNKLNVSGCPSKRDVQRLRSQKQQLDSIINSLNNRLSKFQRLPSKLKGPLNGFKAALKIILSLPIPQSVPPGFGLPINITTKYADIMHLLKEFIKQIDEIIKSIEVVLDTPSVIVGGISTNLNRADNALKACEAQIALQDELDSGNVSIEELTQIGLIDDNEIFIFSTLGPKLLGNTTNSGLEAIGKQSSFNDNSDIRLKGKWISGREYKELDNILFNNQKWSCTKDHISRKDGGKLDGPPGIGPWKELNKLEQESIDTLNQLLRKLNDSNLSSDIKNRIKSILDNFNTPTQATSVADSNFFHTGPNGIVYKLEILTAPDSPAIAPKRFAVAKDSQGVVVLRGPKSFSSSTQVLLNEIKFRIDNQLP